MKKILLSILFLFLVGSFAVTTNSSAQAQFDVKKYIDSGYVLDRLEDFDIDGDKKQEKLISLVSQKADRWKMKILTEKNGKWNIIKEDQESRGVNWHDKNPFLLQIYDFGSDGKQEVVVSKIAWVTLDTRDRSIRYYVFGMVDGKFSDFPISKWYLHTEWFEAGSFPKMISVEIVWGKIIEKYSLLISNQVWKSMSELEYYTVNVVQSFKKGNFLGNIQKGRENNKSTALWELRILNNNVYVFEWGKRVDYLTTRGNVTQECDYPVHNPCVGYQIIKWKGEFGIVLKWVQYEGMENAGPSIFLYNFQKKNSKLIDISTFLYQKYWFDNTLNFHLTENNDQSFTLDAFISDERGMNIADAKKAGFRIWKLDEWKGTNATLIIPSVFFKNLLKK